MTSAAEPMGASVPQVPTPGILPCEPMSAPFFGTFDPYRPDPQLCGNLQVDPEIHLPSPGMDVDISLFYNSASTANGPFGFGRTMSHNLLAQASGSPAVVTLTRGDGSLWTYQDNGGGTFVPQTPGLLNTLVKDVGNSLWKETTPDGFTTAYPLNTTGQITSATYIQDPVGNFDTLSYASGLLQTIKDPVGRLVTFGYSGGLLQTIKDWAGRVTSFAYDSASASPRNLLTTMTGPTGCQTGYQYSDVTLNTGDFPAGTEWLLTGIVDPNGYGTSYSYDQQAHVAMRTIAGVGPTVYFYVPSMTWTVDALGNSTTFLLGNYSAMLGSIDALGAATTFTRNANLQETSRQTLYGATWTTAYGGSGNIIAATDPLGRTTSFPRDAYNNIASVQTADGAIVTNIWGYASSSFDTTGAKRRLQAQVDQLGRTTSWTYNSRGQLVSAQDALGFFTTVGYDAFGNPITVQNALGNIWTGTFDLAGNVSAQQDPLGFRWSTTYDNQNRPLSQVDPLGFRSTAAYDSNGNLTVALNARGFRTSLTYNVFDLPTGVQNALGAFWTSQYDALGRQTASVDPLGNIRTTVFDAVGQPICLVDPLGYCTTPSFDLLGRPIAIQDARGYVNTAVYDAADRVTVSVTPLGYRTSVSYDSVNRPIAVQDALGRFHTTVFDVAGQPVAFVNPLGFRTSVVFDVVGQATAVVDALGRRTTTVFDGIGQQTASVNALGYRTTGVYDSVGQMTALVDANGHRTTASFNGRGDLLSTRDPLGAFTSWSYDGEGNAILRTDARNRLTTYTLDALNRVTGQLYVDSTRVTNTFDVAGQQLTMQDVSGVTTASYDAAGRQVVVINGSGHALTYTRDAVGNTLKIQNTDGAVWFYSYDIQDRCLTVENSNSEFTTLTWDALDRMQRVTLANGMVTSHTWDAAGRETLLANRTSAGVARSVYTASYDAVGNRLTVVELDDTRVTYAYDATSQLANERRSGTNAYNITTSYDPVGNRLVKNDTGSLTTYTHNAANEMTLLVNPTGQPTTQSFDANGNLILANTGGSLTTYTWDGEDRMTRVDNSDGTNEQYTYSADGLRQKKVAGGATVIYVRDGENILLESDTSFVTVARYTDLPGIWGGKFSLRRAGASSFYLPDFQGNTRGLANSSQTITDTLVTDAWGDEIAKTGTVVDPFKAFGQYGYYRDSASRLYVEARHLNTTNGRWLSRDPIGFGGGDENLYEYVGNEPVGLIDPSGLFEGWDLGFFAADWAFYAYDVHEKASPWLLGADIVFIALDAIPLVPAGGSTLFHGAMIAGRGLHFAGAAHDAVVGGRILHTAEAAHATTALARAGRGSDALRRLVALSNPDGARGCPATQQRDVDVAEKWVKKGWTLEAGAGRKQLHLPGPSGGMKGSGRPDLFLTKVSPKGDMFNLFINTFTSLRDGITPTLKEANAAQNIRNLLNQRYQGPRNWRFLMVPKIER